MFQDRCTVAPDEIWVDIWDICFENEGNTSFVYTTCASAAILINDGAKTLTRNVQSNEKINNISVYVTVYASVASKTRILKTATHQHAVSDADVFFFIGHGKKGLCTDFLVHAAGPENLMIIFFCLIECTISNFWTNTVTVVQKWTCRLEWSQMLMSRKPGLCSEAQVTRNCFALDPWSCCR